MGQIEFVGVDGCPCGWFSVGLSQDGRYDVGMFVAFADLLDRYAGSQLILVDMPIGLPGGAEERPSDPEARRLIRPHGPRVFRAPTREALEYLVDNPGNKNGVRAVQRRITGRSLSEQAIAIMPKIAEIDSLLPREADPQIREVHPEICFWALNGERPVVPSKHSEEGIEERLSVLERVEPRAKEIFNAGRAKFPQSAVAKDDDIVDALAVAVTARGGRRDVFHTLPQNPPLDARGLRMEMVYWLPRNDAPMPPDHPEQ